METKISEVLTFIIVTSIIILILVSFIITIFFLYRNKQIAFFRNIEEIRLDYEKALLTAQLEIQEQTFENISREIHDNIGLSLTLAKLQLNTLTAPKNSEDAIKISSSLEQITIAIGDLSHLSKTMNAEFIAENGLLAALDLEIGQIQKSTIFNCQLLISGSPFYIDSRKEVVIFRIIQEALNNAIKHSAASNVTVSLEYKEGKLDVCIEDNGKGFNIESTVKSSKSSGLRNIRHRAKIIEGSCQIESNKPSGVSVKISIPVKKEQATNNE